MTGYFLVADLLGFGQIVTNSSPEQLEDRIGDWIDLVATSARETGLERYQLISDTVFAAAESSEQGLRVLISFARQLLNNGAPKSLLVRGAVAHGEFTWGSKLIYGPAVIAAHELEMSLNWIGVACDPELPHIDSQWDYGHAIAYVPPKKGGWYRVQPVVDWQIPPTHKLIEYLAGGGLTKPDDRIPGEVMSKLNNTVQFGTYRHLARAEKFKPSAFYGHNPMQAIEMVVARCLTQHLEGEGRSA
ncbi:hypothetical protein [Dyella sp. C9]|uniref:hypothetical protein n=1 Tax=Dyella sp. C9 TaxID=2202154 RepID=UPI000DEEC348|nr:hypothetical protein [Dyella sp. C9]